MRRESAELIRARRFGGIEAGYIAATVLSVITCVRLANGRRSYIFFEAGRRDADRQAQQCCARQEYKQRAHAERQS